MRENASNIPCSPTAARVPFPQIGLHSSLFSAVHRQSTWINFCVAWIVSALSYLLLLPFGEVNDLEPNPALCMTQAALVYGAPVVASYATLSLIVQLFINVYNHLREPGDPPKGLTIKIFWLLVCPWILYAIIIVDALEQGLLHMDKVQRGLAFCYVSTNVPGRISAGLTALALLVTVSLEVVVVVVLYRRWRLYRSLPVTKVPPLEMLVRVAAFTVFAFVAICLAGLLVTIRVDSYVDQLILAVMPVAAFLSLGINKDILSVWTQRKGQMIDPRKIAEEEDQGRGYHLPATA
ncbi:hypothetical protein OE88DRAFT_1280658 [Heliocybe sulcata]|uniref:G-protein coupled receptors family 1 profile domain-containing protein n=1 Tax=Heliocybe sulcata TaxID=5364 RepID=A0A5C3NBG0_9AGAM|nr:hypothetical protein OE88DRAFT_1280658 [Heliocybe sulcata]